MKYILALDQGTTSSRALLVAHDGSIAATAQKEFRQIFPQPGWVEHDAEEIWASQAAVIAEVMARSSVTSEDLVAIGITNQRETTVIWDRKTGKPLAHAIVWQDRRTTKLCQNLKNQGLEAVFRSKTGLVLDPYFSGTKIVSLLQSIPGALERAERGELAFGTIDTWLVWKLTGGEKHITDATNASRTLLYNIHTGQWDDELLKILNIPKALLPEIRDSSEIYGRTKHALFAKPIPIAGIAGDQQAALIGQACFKPGMVKTTYGTGCFLLMNIGAEPKLSKNNLLTTVAYQIGGKRTYALEGSVFIAGAVVQWMRDSLGIISQSSEVENLAKSVKDCDGVYFVPAFVGLGAPHWDPYARGAIVGLTRGSTKAHIARAGLEAIAYQVMDVLLAMQKDSQLKIQQLRVDGGAVENNLLMQFQADLMQVPVVRPHVIELTALGAAFLAGLAVGFWKGIDEIASYWKEEKRFLPEMSPQQVEKLRRKWLKALECARLWEDRE